MKSTDHPLFSWIPLASAISDRQVVEQVRREFAGLLATVEGRESSPAEIDVASPRVILVITGGTESAIVDLVSRRTPDTQQEPVILLAHPGNNSLAASLEALALLHQNGVRGEILFFRSGSDQAALNQLRGKVKDIGLFRRLRAARVGLIGTPSDWLVASTFPPELFRQKWGIRIEEYSLADVFAGLEGEQTLPRLPELTAGNDTVLDRSTAVFQQAHKVWEILDQLAAAHRLDALSLQCFRIFERYGTHGCYALSRLNDDGIVAGCEGDLVSTLAMLWVKFHLGQLSWMANPVEFDRDAGTLWLAHCTVPTSMVTGYQQATHFETGCGVALAGTLPPGPVTLVRIGGKALEQLWLADAEVLASGDSPHRCRTQALLRCLDPALLDDLLHRPLGNHLVLTPGHHAAELRQWWETFINVDTGSHGIA